MKASESRRTVAHDPDALGDAEMILARYPRVSAVERDLLGHFLRRGAPIDIGLLSSNATLWRKAERFKLDHPHYFRPSGRVYVGWVIAVIVIAAFLLLIKDIGLN